MFASLGGDFATAAAQLEKARALFDESGDQQGSALADIVAGIIAAALEGEEPAFEHLASSLKGFEQLDDAWGVALGLDVMAWLRTIFCRFDDAGDLFERALRASEQVGDELEIVMALRNLAHARLAAGDIAAARAAAERGLTLLRASASTYHGPELLETLARCSVADGDYTGATELMGAAEAMRESMHPATRGPTRDRYEQLLTELRAALGDVAFAAARDRGRANPDQFFSVSRALTAAT